MRKNYRFNEWKARRFIVMPIYLFLIMPLVAVSQEDSLKTIQLNQLVVSASRTEQKVFDVGRMVSVIPKEEIANSIYNSVAELLSGEEGIYIVGTNQNPGTNQSLFLRGANSNHTNILIDGVRVTDPSTPNAAMDLSELSLLNVERIEIVRGSHGTMYGTSGIGGVINIITKKEGKAGFNGFAEVQSGAFRKQGLSLSENLFINHTFTNGFYTNLAFKNLNARGLDASIDTILSENVFKTSDRDDFDKLDVLAKIGFNNQNLDIFASYKYIDQKSEIDDGAFNDDDNYFLDFNRDLINYGAGYQFSENWKLRFNGGYSTLNRQGENDSSIVDRDGNYDHSFFESDFNGTTFMNEWQANYSGSHFNALIGLGHYDEKTDFRTFFFSGGPFPFESEVNYDSLDLSSSTKYIFFQANLGGGLIGSKLKNLNLITGARYSHHDQFGGNFNFEVNPTYKVSQKSMVYASYSTGFNSPSLVQLFDPSQARGNFTNRGNENLEPETSVSFEVGLKQSINNSIAFSIAYFNTTVENAIEYVFLWNKDKPIDSLTFSDYLGDTYINIAEQKTNGVEFSFESIISKKLSVRGGFSAVNGSFSYAPSDIDRYYTGGNHVQLFSNGEFINKKVEKEGLVRRPVNTINFNLNYRPTPNLTFSGDTRFVSQRDDNLFDPLLGPFGALNTTPVGSYTLVDLTAGFKANDHLYLSVKLENLFDEEYAEIKGFNTRGRGVHLKIRANL